MSAGDLGRMIPDHLRDSRVLIVDDMSANVELLTAMLEQWGLTRVAATTDSSVAVEMCAVHKPDLILLDLHMPHPNGFEVMDQLAPWMHGATPVPIVVLTANDAPEVRRRALSHGARDFVAKPFDQDEVRLRTTNLLEMRRLQRDLARHGDQLEARIRVRTLELDSARRDVLERLGHAAEYRDDATGEHTRRVGRTAGLIAAKLGLGMAAVELISLAAPLHDVGKIGIPDRILLKPARLDREELEAMKRHVTMGAELLAGSGSNVLDVARRIALSHHERWDGDGYRAGLAGDEIPIEGRIVAVADVFDALTHERPYKQAWEPERALDAISEGAGGAFDPVVVVAFRGLDHEALLAPVESATP